MTDGFPQFKPGTKPGPLEIVCEDLVAAIADIGDTLVKTQHKHLEEITYQLTNINCHLCRIADALERYRP